MKNKLIVLLGLLLVLNLTSCKEQNSYVISKIEGDKIAIDSSWDQSPNEAALQILAPYKAGVDSVMNEVVGFAPVTLIKERPESPLSNLIADVLRFAATETLGKPADIGLVNMGGIRNILPQGDITVGTVFEILPFENSLCILQLKGSAVKELMQNIAKVQGEGVSNINLVSTKDGKVLSAKVGGKEIVDDQIYTLATIDYLAEGNDGMTALMQSESKICPEGATLRSLFMNYVKNQTVAGKTVTAKVEDRIIVQ